MQYSKPHLSFEQQVDLLLQKGLNAEREELLARLQDIGYYRLSAYTHPFRERDKQGNTLSRFIPGTTLDSIINHYRFDRQLRLILLDAIERIEISLRSWLVHYHTATNGPFAYARIEYFPHWKGYAQLLDKVRIRKDTKGGLIYRGEEAIDHFFSKYGSHHEILPLWIAVSSLEFGSLVYLDRKSVV